MPLVLCIVLGVLVLIVGAAVVVVLSNGDESAPIADSDSDSSSDSDAGRGDSDAPDDHLVQGTGPVVVEVYLDFMCDHCSDFHTASHDRIVTEAAAGTITVHYRPIALLDSWSAGSDYSTRAANAAACAAVEGAFNEYATILLTTVPTMGSTGLDDSELSGVGSQLGLSSEFESCVTSGKYKGWVADTTQKAMDSGVAGVPHVTIDGELLASPTLEFGPKLDAALK